MFSDILKRLRKQKGVSQAELARQLNVVQQTVGKWETNAAVPSISTIKELALYFDVTVDYLLEMPQKSHDRQENIPLPDFPKNIRVQVGKYCTLSQNSRKVVDATLDSLWEFECENESLSKI